MTHNNNEGKDPMISTAAAKVGRMIALTVIALATLAAGSNSAEAGTYEVSQCRLPNGEAIGAPDMVGSSNAQYSYWSIDCAGADARMGVWFEPTVSHPFGADAALTFTSPPSTSVIAVRGNRLSRVSPGSSFRNPMAKIETSAQELESCVGLFGCSGFGTGSGVAASNAFAFSGFDSTVVRFKVLCGGGADCVPEDPMATLQVYRAEFTLRDPTDPTAGAVTGGLVTPGVKTGTLGAFFNASDSGGGVYRTLIKVDGAVVDADVVNSNGGDCQDVVPGGDPYEFARAVPCKLSAAAAPTLDTSVASDGTHQLTVEVEDAAGNRSVVFAPASFAFDNRPPEAGTLSVGGTPRNGQTLNAAAAGFGGQSPSMAYEWLRCDSSGSGCAPIGGATGTSYALTSAEVGDTIRAAVHATDAGGQTTVTSLPSAQVQEAPPTAGSVAIEPRKPVIGSPARAQVGGLAGNGVDLDYTWQRCSATGASCVAILDANAASYTPEEVDGGKTLRVLVTATNAGGSTQAASAPSDVLDVKPNGGGAGGNTGGGNTGGGNTGGGNTPGGDTGGGNPPGAGSSSTPNNGTNATRDARIVFSQSESSKRSVKFGRSVNIIGRLLTPSGKGIGGAAVDIVARVKRRGETGRRVATVRTDARGFFKYATAKGPSRTFDVAYRAVLTAVEARADAAVEYDARQRVELDVAAGVSLGVSPRRARNLQTLIFRGRLLGAPFPKRGKQVLLQAQIKRRGKVNWQTFLSVPASKRGDFVGRYRLTRTFQPTVYRFRAVVPRGDDYPYTTGSSKVVKVPAR